MLVLFLEYLGWCCSNWSLQLGSKDARGKKLSSQTRVEHCQRVHFTPNHVSLNLTKYFCCLNKPENICNKCRNDQRRPFEAKTLFDSQQQLLSDSSDYLKTAHSGRGLYERSVENTVVHLRWCTCVHMYIHTVQRGCTWAFPSTRPTTWPLGRPRDTTRLTCSVIPCNLSQSSLARYSNLSRQLLQHCSVSAHTVNQTGYLLSPLLLASSIIFTSAWHFLSLSFYSPASFSCLLSCPSGAFALLYSLLIQTDEWDCVLVLLVDENIYHFRSIFVCDSIFIRPNMNFCPIWIHPKSSSSSHGNSVILATRPRVDGKSGEVL